MQPADSCDRVKFPIVLLKDVTAAHKWAFCQKVDVCHFGKKVVLFSMNVN